MVAQKKKSKTFRPLEVFLRTYFFNNHKDLYIVILFFLDIK